VTRERRPASCRANRLQALGRLAVLVAVACVSAHGEEGPADASPSDAQLCYRLRQLIVLNRTDEALEELERIHALGRKPEDYRTTLEHVLQRIRASAYNLALLDRLVAAHPKSPLPLLARGSTLISYAWEARGSGYANQVSKEGWKGFGERIERARKDLDRAHSLDPDLALVSATRIIVARAQSRPEAEVRALFADAIRADPTCYKAYRSLLEYLKPRWHGSRKALLDFAEGSVAEHPEAPELRMLQAEAWLDQINLGGLELNAYLARTPADLRRLREAWDAVIEAYPRAAEALHQRRALAQGVLKEDDGPYLRGLALAGIEQPQFELGYSLLETDPQQAIAWIEAAALGRKADAAAALSNFYTLGQYGLPVDREASSGWLGHAAACGSLDAQRMIGMRFLEGNGVAPDPSKARYWFKRAALRGDGKAMNSYAIALLLGQGGPRDQKLALEFFLRAAENGSSAALLMLGQAYEQGQVGPGPNPYRVEVDLRRALDCYKRAGELGLAQGRQRYEQLLARHPELR